MKTADLSETMLAVRDKAVTQGGCVLVRQPGGFWTLPSAKHDGHSWGWWAGTSTVHALVTRGAAHYTEYRNRRRDGQPYPVQVTMQEAWEP